MAQSNDESQTFVSAFSLLLADGALKDWSWFTICLKRNISSILFIQESIIVLINTTEGFWVDIICWFSRKLKNEFEFGIFLKILPINNFLNDFFI